MSRLFYKVLNEDGSARMGRGKWHLPRGSHPGKWMPAIRGDLVACKNGYHLCRRNDLVGWLGPTIYEAEYRGEMIESDNKIVVREARLLRRVDAWNNTTARLFACDCSAHVLKFFEQKCPDDKRPRKAIAVARRFARGRATKEELVAAGAAAWDAAGAAAWAAAWDAAGDAAWAAAWDAAGAAERAWQTERLFQYLDGKLPKEENK